MYRNRTLCTLIVLQIVYVLFIPVWLLIAGIAAMAVSDPNADAAAALLVMIGVLLYPVALLLALILGWLKFGRRHFKASLIWNGLPLIWIVPLGGFLLAVNIG
ncbi:hypothetical protein ACF3MZ_02405 [Paenibacillaceae bacterium WGS1546]|uniref:hypothetical protein n=1 Tax=Cohnella sp. WGS1546 TaxID=3366810 RepID=UPI00372D1AE5